MSTRGSWTDTVIGISPFATPDAGLTTAVCEAGALGVLDLGVGDRTSREALARVRSGVRGTFGVRVAAGCTTSPQDLRGAAGSTVPTVVLVAGTPGWDPREIRAHHRLLVEVTTLDQALAAVASGAHGLVARGAESGGRVGELSSFVLLQQLLAAPGIAVPVWACGGIGLRTAAAAVASGAAGVVLDTQLALLAESSVPGEVAALVRRMDGSETVVLDARRVLKGGTTNTTRALEVGQDGFLATVFADRWGTVGRAVNALQDAIGEVLTAAAVPHAADRWLGPEAPLCEVLGTELPLAQGPMTRVSDQPGFAAAVAAAGALPFVALALASAAQTRTLLAETAAALGGRAWGVGVLGFAPAEVRGAQLAEVLAARPTHAVIAGGRPSQARILEDAGITTFLHVPSPGLLQQFLADGARRFVFEGAECGGHIGPRHSFALWEAQLAVLEDFLTTAKGSPRVDALFAGGIHDERSAALVAAMTAPLADRGLAAGTLMGTAYLFTDEAVAYGAVQPEFQRQVLRATGTDLLQTAPGHVTRCIASPFTAEFEAQRSRLKDAGVADRDAWEQLEHLNIGRLRIASKGLERVGDALVEVDADGQLDRGMFMAGQVAVLRSATTTVADLHAAVSTGAAELLADRAVTMGQILGLGARPAERAAPMDIAVIGMACVFPQAPDLQTFWANVLGGIDAVTEVPVDRWDPALYWSADGEAGTTRSKWGGFLSPIAFDPLSYGIPPAALGSIEPVQLLSLEVARRALVDAGYDAGSPEGGRTFDRSRTCVIFGAEAGSDLSGAGVLGAMLPAYLGKVPDGIAAQLPTITEDSFPGMLANVISGRIANRLDLGGSNFTVDAACASSLAALDVACKELVAGTSDLALCGGADLHNGINDYLLFASVQALSPTGRSRPFDSSADGIALGEGAACLVLKRLADAERDGDRVYAVVSGVGSASDGQSLGLTAPRPEGQRAALERAYRSAGITPAEVGLVEAHGTGTVVGDRTELTTLTELFLDAGAAPESCSLGSVKSQIGHTKCAAGLAGLIKATLALYTGVKPPTLHLARPNPAWQADTSPFGFHTEARPWAAPAAERVAGVSAFGFGGTNFHAVLRASGGPAPAHGLDQWPAELFTFRGADRARAQTAVAELLRLAETSPNPWRLRDLALAASRRAEAGHGPVQVAVVASDIAELAALLRRALDGEHAPSAGLHLADADPGSPSARSGQPDTASDGKVAFLFPGQGSQRLGMFAELFTAFPWLQRHLQHGPDYARVVFAPAAFTPEAREEQRLRVLDTRVAQPALGMAGLAAFDLLGLAGVRPDLVGGHSYGELIALCAAGALAVEDLPLLSHERGRVILEAVSEGADPGSMAAVVAGAADIEQVLAAAGLAGRVVAANLNAPLQTVISGGSAEVTLAMERLSEAGFGVKKIPVACAFHSPVVAGAGALFADVLATRAVHAPEFPVFANRTAGPYPADPAAIRAELVAQLGSPVRFADQVEAMYAAGARVFVEAGPGSVLTRLVSAVLGDRPHTAVPLEGRRRGVAGFLDALAELAVAGVGVDTGRLMRGRDAVDAGRAKAPRRAGWTVDGHLVRTVDGELLPGALAPARIVKESWVSAQADEFNHQSAADALVADFIRSGREMIAAQRDVLLTHLGAEVMSGQAWIAAPVAPLAVAARTSPAVATAPPLTLVAAPQPASAPAALTEADILRAVIAVIAERTGYPAEMIEPDLDLESELSIDSIKRTEIVGLLAQRLTGDDEVGLESLSDGELEELSGARTAFAVTAWLTARLGTPVAPVAPGASIAPPVAETAADSAPVAAESAPVAAESAPVAAESAPVAAEPAVVGHAPVRLQLTRTALSATLAPAHTLAGKRFLVLGGDDTAGAVTARLASLGAEVLRRDAWYETSASDGPIDGVLLLDPLCADGPAVLPGAVPALQAALQGLPNWLIAAHRAGSGRADGLRGLMRSLSREYPGTVVRVVELDEHADSTETAAAVLDELLAEDREPVVLRGTHGRDGLALIESDLGVLASTGAGPAGDGAAEAAALGLDRDAVVLLVGGARGITARFAATLAAASHCRLELIGRTPEPAGPEDPVTAAAHDRQTLRAVLARAGVLLPEIDAAASALLAQREVAATLAELSALGSEAYYSSVDAADPAALRQAVKEVHAAYGRLDGVIFAAGVIEDKVFAEKDPLSFERVFATKAEGACALLDALADLPQAPRFTALFGSISAVLGNRGQSDYAAANDALESLGARWAERTGTRALTVHWGPWAPAGLHAGMVSEALARDYDRRGIRLIDPSAGTLALLRELAWGPPELRSVVYTASGW